MALVLVSIITLAIHERGVTSARPAKQLRAVEMNDVSAGRREVLLETATKNSATETKRTTPPRRTKSRPKVSTLKLQTAEPSKDEKGGRRSEGVVAAVLTAISTTAPSPVPTATPSASPTPAPATLPPSPAPTTSPPSPAPTATPPPSPAPTVTPSTTEQTAPPTTLAASVPLSTEAAPQNNTAAVTTEQPKQALALLEGASNTQASRVDTHNCDGSVDPFKDISVDTFKPPEKAPFKLKLEWEDSVHAMMTSIRAMSVGGPKLRDFIKAEARKLQIKRVEMFCPYY